jgi:hypothetical protein
MSSGNRLGAILASNRWLLAYRGGRFQYFAKELAGKLLFDVIDAPVN